MKAIQRPFEQTLCFGYLYYTKHTYIAKFDCCGHVHLLRMPCIQSRRQFFQFWSIGVVSCNNTCYMHQTHGKYWFSHPMQTVSTKLQFVSIARTHKFPCTKQSTTSIFIAMGEFLIQFNFSHITRDKVERMLLAMLLLLRLLAVLKCNTSASILTQNRARTHVRSYKM